MVAVPSLEDPAVDIDHGNACSTPGLAQVVLVRVGVALPVAVRVRLSNLVQVRLLRPLETGGDVEAHERRSGPVAFWSFVLNAESVKILPMRSVFPSWWSATSSALTPWQEEHRGRKRTVTRTLLRLLRSRPVSQLSSTDLETYIQLRLETVASTTARTIGPRRSANPYPATDRVRKWNARRGANPTRRGTATSPDSVVEHLGAYRETLE